MKVSFSNRDKQSMTANNNRRPNGLSQVQRPPVSPLQSRPPPHAEKLIRKVAVEQHLHQKQVVNGRCTVAKALLKTRAGVLDVWAR